MDDATREGNSFTLRQHIPQNHWDDGRCEAEAGTFKGAYDIQVLIELWNISPFGAFGNLIQKDEWAGWSHCTN